ncbi:MAG TPA: hydrogenase expression/formation protein HypE [Polyangiaceae bacterium]|nr:hydrogenase expression/formation protein HypE [Polyangiaceae bacterium]
MSDAARARDTVSFDASCPIPASRYDAIVLGHGSGGRLSRELLETVFLPALGQGPELAQEDQAVVPLPTSGRLAITTDSFVVSPLVFPGGDIGSLSIHGTVNDLAVGGARPLYITASFILEEGLSTALLRRLVESMRRACDAVPVRLVAGDTKVVDRGKADGVFITTTGVGVVPDGVHLSATLARPGDRVVVSGPLGDHGIAILASRQGIELETALESDSAALHGLARAVLDASTEVRCMRDPTRGGLSSALNEIAAASRVGISLRESDIPLRPEVRGACELLGLDPLYVACEGRLVAIVGADDAGRVLAAMQGHPLGRDAAVIGRVTAERPGIVSLKSVSGGERVVALLSGEQLPRIC